MSMNAVAFCGFSQLAVEERMVLVKYVMVKSNWARLVKKKNSEANIIHMLTNDSVNVNDDVQFVGESSRLVSMLPPALVKVPGNALVSTSGLQRFIVPRPGINGALGNALAGKTVVLTGLFPELGGGGGLNLGKDKARAM